MYNIISMDTTIEALETKCRNHDWYYNYSDDHKKWSRGYDNKREIYAILDALEYSEEAVCTFNTYAPDDFKIRR